MSDIVLNNELYIVYDGTQIACTTDFSLNLEKAQIDINCGGGWSGNLGGSKSWSIDFSAIVKRADTNLIYSQLMAKLFIEEQPVTAALRSSIGNDKYYQGLGNLINLTQTGSTDDKVTYSGTIEGYGPLNILTEEATDLGFQYLLEMEIIG